MLNLEKDLDKTEWLLQLYYFVASPSLLAKGENDFWLLLCASRERKCCNNRRLLLSKYNDIAPDGIKHVYCGACKTIWLLSFNKETEQWETKERI